MEVTDPLSSLHQMIFGNITFISRSLDVKGFMIVLAKSC